MGESGRLTACPFGLILVRKSIKQVGGIEKRAVLVRLDFAQGDGALGKADVGEVDGFSGVLPALIAEPAARLPDIFDVAVSVRISEGSHPLQGPADVRQQRLDLGPRQPPAPQRRVSRG